MSNESFKALLVEGRELKRIQDHALSLADRVASGQRMLFCLDRYWLAYEYDADWMALWWNAFERYRAQFEMA